MVNKVIKDTMMEDQQQIVHQAVDAGISRYIQTRRAQVPAFVSKHFSIKGALRLHKKALGKDLYKGPLNILMAIPSIMAKASSAALRKLGEKNLSAFLDKMPPGFETDVQKEVSWLIYTELLELPYNQGFRSSSNDALLTEILNDDNLSDCIAHYLSVIHEKSGEVGFRQALEENLREYSTSRTAAADLAGSIITLSAGVVAFHKAVPGSLAAGSLAASAIAQNIAISNFWLGSTLGSWYYGVFPASASSGLLITTTGTLLIALSVLTTFAGVVIDPLQAKLGIHQKRLLKFIDSLEVELTGEGDMKFKIKDQYIARIFDIVDVLKIASGLIR